MARNYVITLCSSLPTAAWLLQYLYFGVFLFNVTLQIIQPCPTTSAQGAHVIPRIVSQVMIL